jgi:hypothetical protein
MIINHKSPVMKKIVVLLLLITHIALGQAPKKTDDFVNVKSLGVKGNGIADDGPAIQAAIDAYAKLYFPDGLYKVNDELLVNKKIAIKGGKKARIIKNFNAPNTALFKCKHSDIEISGLKIEGITKLKFIQNEYGIHMLGTPSNIYDGIKIFNNQISDIGHGAICIEYCKDFQISNNRINNISSAGIEVLSSEKGAINKNYIKDILVGSSGNAYGIILTLRLCDVDDPSKDIVVKNNTVVNVPIWEGIDTHAGQDIQIVGNTILNCAYGINASKCNNTSTMVPNNITIANNIIKKGTVTTPGRGIGSGGSASMYAKNIIVKNNQIDGYGMDNNSEGAIMFYSTRKLQINANTITNSLSSGINIQNRNEDYSVTKNTIRRINKGTTNAAGIIIRNEGQSGLVQDNYVDASKELGMMVYGKGSNNFKNNTFLGGRGKYVGAEHVKGLELVETATKDLDPIDENSNTNFTVNVNAARVGDDVTISTNVKLANVSIVGSVSAINIVTVKIENNSGKKVDPPLIKYTIKVTKQ